MPDLDQSPEGVGGQGGRPGDWSDAENEVTVGTYLSMLKREIEGVPFTKVAENAALREHLNNRTKGAVEFKFQNISAILAEENLPYITGYKPLFNVQNNLRDEVLRQFRSDPELVGLIHEQPESGEWDRESFAERLNHLFNTKLDDSGKPYSTEEMVNSLSDEGLPISAETIDQLRLGTAAEKPSALTIDAIAFFFDAPRENLIQDARTSRVAPAVPVPALPPDPVCELQLDDLRTLMAGLSRAIAERLQQPDADIEFVSILSELLADAGEIFTNSRPRPALIRRSFFERLISALAIAGSGGNGKLQTYLRVTETFRAASNGGHR